MSDQVIDGVIFVLIFGVLWLLGYRGHFNMETSQRSVTDLPKWMRLLSGHAGKAILDLHSLVWQITALAGCLIHTIALFIPNYMVYRSLALWITMIGSLGIGWIFVSILNRFYRVKK